MGVRGEQGTLGVRLDWVLQVTSAGQAASAMLAALRSRETRVLVRTYSVLSGSNSGALADSPGPGGDHPQGHHGVTTTATEEPVSPAPPCTTPGCQCSQSACGVPSRHVIQASRTSPFDSLESLSCACVCDWLMAKLP